MNILELFAGSCSFSNVAKELGHSTFTSDIQQYGKIDYVCDIMDFDVNKVPFEPTIVWCSPPCTFFSVCSIGHHWNKDHTPKTENAKLGMAIVKKTVEILDQFPSAKWYIENPRGKLRKLGLIGGWMRTVCYCKYGDSRMKPTDVWTNDFNWVPRPMCFNGNKDCHHQSAPRGSSTGTQGLKGSYERSKVPRELCLEILNG